MNKNCETISRFYPEFERTRTRLGNLAFFWYKTRVDFQDGQIVQNQEYRSHIMYVVARLGKKAVTTKYHPNTRKYKFLALGTVEAKLPPPSIRSPAKIAESLTLVTPSALKRSVRVFVISNEESRSWASQDVLLYRDTGFCILTFMAPLNKP